MNFQKAMEQRNRDNAFCAFIGARLTEMSEGHAVGELVVTEQHRNPNGAIHGGCIYTLADMTSGAASAAYGIPTATLDYSFHYLNAALSDVTKLIAAADVMKHGRRTTVLNVEVKDQNDRLLAAGIATHMTIHT